MAAIWLITGGVRAGKSRLAARLAAESRGPVTYIATAEAGDEEMRARIAAHRRERPEEWTTIEEAQRLESALRRAPAGTVVVDCLTIWVSNRLLALQPDGSASVADLSAAQRVIADEVEAVLGVAAAREGRVVVVTNEVGQGLIAESVIGRGYVDTLGRVNQRVAAAAERVYLCVAGLALELKSSGAEPI